MAIGLASQKGRVVPHDIAKSIKYLLLALRSARGRNLRDSRRTEEPCIVSCVAPMRSL